MARSVYFVFDYGDVKDFKANVVRQSWVTQDREAAGFWDAVDWEKVKKQGGEAIKRWIDKQLVNTSVTAVLIGTDTSKRKWVKYEIKKSYTGSKGLLGVYIHNIKDEDGNKTIKGENPFDKLYIVENGKKVYFLEMFPTYDWVNDKGYDNLGTWVEKAAKKAGR